MDNQQNTNNPYDFISSILENENISKFLNEHAGAKDLVYLFLDAANGKFSMEKLNRCRPIKWNYKNFTKTIECGDIIQFILLLKSSKMQDACVWISKLALYACMLIFLQLCVPFHPTYFSFIGFVTMTYVLLELPFGYGLQWCNIRALKPKYYPVQIMNRLVRILLLGLSVCISYHKYEYVWIPILKLYTMLLFTLWEHAIESDLNTLAISPLWNESHRDYDSETAIHMVQHYRGLIQQYGNISKTLSCMLILCSFSAFLMNVLNIVRLESTICTGIILMLGVFFGYSCKQFISLQVFHNWADKGIQDRVYSIRYIIIYTLLFVYFYCNHCMQNGLFILFIFHILHVNMYLSDCYFIDQMNENIRQKYKEDRLVIDEDCSACHRVILGETNNSVQVFSNLDLSKHAPFKRVIEICQKQLIQDGPLQSQTFAIEENQQYWEFIRSRGIALKYIICDFLTLYFVLSPNYYISIILSRWIIEYLSKHVTKNVRDFGAHLVKIKNE